MILDINLLLNILTFIAIGLIVYIYKKSDDNIKRNTEKIEATEKDINEIKFNYLDRFSGLDKNLNSMKSEIIDRLDEQTNQAVVISEITKTSSKKIQELYDDNKEMNKAFTQLLTEHNIRTKNNHNC